MKPAASFKDILDLRGRIVIFTASASVGLKFEQMAERHHAQVVTIRGWADKSAPLYAWRRLHDTREFGLLSLTQANVAGFRVHATDLVWVGDMGHPRDTPHTWLSFSQAMGRAHPEDDARLWTLNEDALYPPSQGDAR